MSCYKLTAKEINVLTATIINTSQLSTNTESVFKTLATANNRSVNARYNERKHATKWNADAYNKDNGTQYSIPQLVKLIDCYQYQCDNAPGWENSQAEKLTALTRTKLIEQYPADTLSEFGSFSYEYDSATWGLD